MQKSKRQRKRMKEAWGFHLQVYFLNSRNQGPAEVRSQEIHLGLWHGWQEANHFKPSLAASQVCVGRNLEARLKPGLSRPGTLMWKFEGAFEPPHPAWAFFAVWPRALTTDWSSVLLLPFLFSELLSHYSLKEGSGNPPDTQSVSRVQCKNL